LYHNSDTFPFSSFFNDILTDFFGILNIFYYVNDDITKPNGPNLGARVAAGPGSPPKTLMLTEINQFITESDFVGIDFWGHCIMVRISDIIFFY
jgi:hypothetical protein